MTSENRVSWSNKDAIEQLLLGRKVVEVNQDTLVLDNGRKLRFVGHTGGCDCDSGNYPLTELNGVDNIITNVDFDDNPGGDNYPTRYGHYKIFVFADNTKVNLATFTGTNGNGCYGTGYQIHVADR